MSSRSRDHAWRGLGRGAASPWAPKSATDVTGSSLPVESAEQDLPIAAAVRSADTTSLWVPDTPLWASGPMWDTAPSSAAVELPSEAFKSSSTQRTTFTCFFWSIAPACIAAVAASLQEGEDAAPAATASHLLSLTRTPDFNLQCPVCSLWLRSEPAGGDASRFVEGHIDECLTLNALGAPSAAPATATHEPEDDTAMCPLCARELPVDDIIQHVIVCDGAGSLPSLSATPALTRTASHPDDIADIERADACVAGLSPEQRAVLLQQLRELFADDFATALMFTPDGAQRGGNGGSDEDVVTQQLLAQLVESSEVRCSPARPPEHAIGSTVVVEDGVASMSMDAWKAPRSRTQQPQGIRNDVMRSERTALPKRQRGCASSSSRHTGGDVALPVTAFRWAPATSTASQPMSAHLSRASDEHVQALMASIPCVCGRASSVGGAHTHSRACFESAYRHAYSETDRLRRERRDVSARLASVSRHGRYAGGVAAFVLQSVNSLRAQQEIAENAASRVLFMLRNSNAAVPGRAGSSGSAGGGVLLHPTSSARLSSEWHDGGREGGHGAAITVDLHGQHAAGAVERLRDDVIPSARAKGVRRIVVITGIGLHSDVSGATMKSRVHALLTGMARDRHVRSVETLSRNEGYAVVL